MKKFFIMCGIISFVISVIFVQNAFAVSSDDIKNAITEYKEGNYLGCISNLNIYLEEDPSNVVAWYYLGTAYMKISMKPEAHEAFDNVVQINTVPKLTSYAIQAKMCMENGVMCTYQDFTNEEIRDLRANPAEFLAQYFAKLNSKDVKSKDTVEIDKLIKGGYGNNIHPDAQSFIMQQKMQKQQAEMNNDKAYLPVSDKTAEAALMMQQYNNDVWALAMFLEDNYNNSNRYNNLLQYYQGENKELTPESVKYSIMRSMLPAF